ASRGARPDGNAVATEATSTPVPRRAVTALATMSGYTHTAPTVGTVRSAGSGWAALVHSARTLPGVSAPSRVVRSTMEMARSMAVALAVVLTDRVDRSLARAAAPTSSTPGSPYRYARSERLVIASGAVVVWGTGTFRVELCAGRPVRCDRRVRDLVGPLLQKGVPSSGPSGSYPNSGAGGRQYTCGPYRSRLDPSPTLDRGGLVFPPRARARGSKTFWSGIMAEFRISSDDELIDLRKMAAALAESQGWARDDISIWDNRQGEVIVTVDDALLRPTEPDPLHRPRHTPGDVHRACEHLRREEPSLRRVDFPVLRKETARFFSAGWTVADVLYALTHRPDQVAWPQSPEFRGTEWLRRRLAAWRTPDGDIRPSRSQEESQLRVISR